MIITIEGNIGCGKSSLVEKLSKKYICFPEPVKEWTLLDKFYLDPKRFAFPFQFQILLSLYSQMLQIKKCNPEKYIFVECSAWASQNIFVEFMRDGGYWPEYNNNQYNDIYSLIEENNSMDLMIFIKCSPKTCKQRILQRSHCGEQEISIQYLYSLNNMYEQRLELFPSSIHHVNGETNTSDMLLEEAELHIQEYERNRV